MVKIGDITDTTLRGLGIGVLAGVSGGVMKMANKAFGFTKPRKKKSKRRKKRR